MPSKNYRESENLKKSIIALTFILMTMLCGCKKSDYESYSKAYESLLNMESYSADIEVTVFSQGGKTKYQAKQYYAAPDCYRVDFEDEETGKTVCVLNGETLKFRAADGSVTEFSGYVPSEKYYIFIADFMERYCKSEASKNGAKGKTTVLSVPKSKEKPAMKLYISKNGAEPKKLVTYDEGGKEKIVVEFKNFKMNAKMNKKLFDI